MKRISTPQRVGWEKKVEELGLLYHTPNGRPYWDESAYYSFTMTQVEELEAATNELQRLCLAAGQHIIDNNLFAQLGLSEISAKAIRRAWDQEPPAIYGRFDLAYDGVNPPKLLEYNADTPTSLLEASVVQWYWLQERGLPDQWNSIHERLIAKWKELRAYIREPLYFAHVDSAEHEDWMTVAYLRDTANEAGIPTRGIEMRDIGWDASRHVFVDQDELEMQTIFKLYPWEWLVDEEFSDQLFESLGRGTQWIEPIWKMLWSNKGILPILWQLFPDHPNLLPAVFQVTERPEDGQPGDYILKQGSYVRKPMLSREGQNIHIEKDGVPLAHTDGEYADCPCVYQGLAPIPEIDGNYPVIGAWVIDGEAAGMGIRESRTMISDNLARFIPHCIEG